MRLRLRVTTELSERIDTQCSRHGHTMEGFLKRVARQMLSGRIVPASVLKNRRRGNTTKYKVLSVDTWSFELRGKRLVAGIEIALDRLEGLPVERPRVDESELKYIGFIN